MLAESFKKLFIHQLKDIFSAEVQLSKTFSRLGEAAESPELRDAFEDLYEQNRDQEERLRQSFTLLKENPEGQASPAMEGLIKEVDDILTGYPHSYVRDAAMIARVQPILLYQVAMYGTMRTFADHLDLSEIADLLQESLDEEGEANRILTKIAEGGFFTSGINQKAQEET